MTIDHDDLTRLFKDAVADVRPTLTGADLDRRLRRNAPTPLLRRTPALVTTRPRALAWAAAATLVLVAGLGVVFFNRTRPASIVASTTTTAVTGPSTTATSTATVAPGPATSLAGGVPTTATGGAVTTVAPVTVATATGVPPSSGVATTTPDPATTAPAPTTPTATTDPTTVATTAPPTTVAPTTAPPLTTTVAPTTTTTVASGPFRPLGTAASVNSADTSMRASFTAIQLTDGLMSVVMVATGPADLPRPEATCLTVTGRSGVRHVVPDIAPHITTDQPGSYAGTFTFGGIDAGTFDVQYACQPGWSQARIATLDALPAGVYWGDIRPLTSAVPDASYSVTYWASQITGGNLEVYITADGPAATLPRPETTCLSITTVAGVRTVVTPTSVALSTDTPGSFAGTLRYADPGPGSYTIQYGCTAAYGQTYLGARG